MVGRRGLYRWRVGHFIVGEERTVLVEGRHSIVPLAFSGCNFAAWFQNERKFNSRLFDLKDRLEQCHSTNRSMQNYVQFLKNSYANVFGESAPYGPSSLKPPIP